MFRQRYCLLAVCLLSISSFILYFCIHQYIRYSIKQFLILSPNAKRFPDWVDIKGETKVEIWFWNITSPLYDLRNNKVVLKEVGPYVYSIKRHKHDIYFNQSSISYGERFEFTFERSLSVSDEDDHVTVFNFASLSILSNIDMLPSILRKAISAIIQIFEQDQSSGGTLFIIKRSVHDILFGFQDPFLHAIKKIPFLSDISDTVRLINNPIEDYMTVANGASITPAQTVISWRNLSTLNMYKKNPYCNIINGTDGNLFTIPLKNKMKLFLPDLCRTIEVEREQSMNPRLLRYRLSVNNSINVQCSDKFADTLLFDLPCERNAPVVISNPHFLYADSKFYKDLINNFSPDDSNHLSRIDIDSLTGYPLYVNKRIQINFQSAEHSVYFKSFAPNQLYPVLWMNQSFRAREQDVSFLHRYVHLPSMVTTVISIVLAICALFLAMISGCVFLYRFYKKNIVTDEEFIDEADEECSETDPLIHNAY